MFHASDARTDKPQVVILNYALWKTRFGGREDVIGETVQLGHFPCAVIGVMPPGFLAQPGGPELFTVIQIDSKLSSDFSTRGMLVETIGRLKPGVTLELGASDLQVINERLAREHPAHAKSAITLVPLLETQVKEVRPLLLLLLGAVSVLLLIACVNVANLLLARGSMRQKELALRAALGAGRPRIARQLLVESVLIATIAGLAGAGLAYGMLAVLLQFAPVDLPRLAEVRVAPPALAFALGVSIITGLGFGLLPAWQCSRVDLTTALKEGGGRAASDSRGRRRLRSLLVVVEISLALALSVGAGLLLRSVKQLNAVDLGYTPDVVHVSRILLLPHRYPDGAARRAFVDRALEQLAGNPQLRAVAFSNAFPHHQNPFAGLVIQGQPEGKPAELPRVCITSITPDFFRVMNNPLRAGRWFTERDRDGAPPVAIVSEYFARKHFPGEDPLGKRIDVAPSLQGRVWREIVGVVTDIKSAGPAYPMPPQMYVPFDQALDSDFMVAIRVAPGAPNPAPVVAAAIHSTDPEMPVPTMMTCIAEYVGHTMAIHRFTLFLFTVSASIALLLSALGIYAVMAFSVTQRTQEIGVRMALGAAPGEIMRLVLAQALPAIVIGLVAGIALALSGATLLRTLLFEVRANDPLTLGLTIVILAVVAFLGCWLPARRATRVDPMVALRHE